MRRDAFDVASAYWGLAHDRLVTSQRIDDVAGQCAGALDDDAALDYLALGFVTDPQRTLFEGLQRLPAGHALELSPRGIPRVQRWYDVPPRDYPSALTDGKLAAVFWDMLVESVASRVGAARGRPIVISLSGGLDSVAIACALREVVGRENIRAVTFGFSASTDDREPEVARRAARELGIEWEIIDASADDPLAAAPAAPRWYPVTALTASAVRWRALTDGAVVFYGLGGDSILAADPHFWRARIASGNWGVAAAELLRTTLVHGLRPGFGTTRLRQRLGRRLRGARPTDPAFALIAPAFRDRATRKLHSLRAPWTARGVELLTDPWWSWIFDSLSQAPGDVEVALPFFDARLAAFVATVPTAPWLVDKELLRTALRGRIGDDIRLRPKVPLASNPMLQFSPEHVGAAIDEVRRADIGRLVDVEAFRDLVARGSCRYTDHHDLARVLALARLVLRTQAQR